MTDLVGNTEDRFSCNTAQISSISCYSEIDCGDPSVSLPAGGTYTTLTGASFLDGGSFVFNCGEGFTPSGQSDDGNYDVRCKSNGRWSYGTLTCLGKHRKKNQKICIL